MTLTFASFNYIEILIIEAPRLKRLGFSLAGVLRGGELAGQVYALILIAINGVKQLGNIASCH